jgi:hypothetical protein
VIKLKLDKEFIPPSLDRLADVDVADCGYATELCEIVGVVAPTNQAGWPASQDYEVHTFSFAAWRCDHEAVRQSELIVLRPVAPESDWYGDFQTGEILRCEVLLSNDRSRAVMPKLIQRNCKDKQLEAVADQLSVPVRVETQKFGTLVLDRKIGWFRGKTIWNRHEVQISFQAQSEAELSELLTTAHSLLDAEEEWQGKIESLVIEEKLPLANEWRSDVTRPISERQFLERMTLESISISADGHFEFWHDDGELFHGHAIQIAGSLSGGLTRSEIPG